MKLTSTGRALLYLTPAAVAAVVHLFISDGHPNGFTLVVYILTLGGLLLWSLGRSNPRYTAPPATPSTVWQGERGTCRYGGIETPACWHPSACGCRVVQYPTVVQAPRHAARRRR